MFFNLKSNNGSRTVLISGEFPVICSNDNAVVLAINRVPNLGKISKSIRNSHNESTSVWKTQLLLLLLLLL